MVNSGSPDSRRSSGIFNHPSYPSNQPTPTPPSNRNASSGSGPGPFSGPFTFAYDMSRDSSGSGMENRKSASNISLPGMLSTPIGGGGRNYLGNGGGGGTGGGRSNSGDQGGSSGASPSATVGTPGMTGIGKGKSAAEAEAEAKRRKIQRACDVCRRKKIKCDGPMNSLSTSKCAHCEEYGLDCTYVEAAKRRGPPKGYMETLEQRCGRLERLLNQLHPGVDFNEYVGPSLDREDFDLSSYNETLRHHHIPPYPQIKPLTAPLNTSASSHASASPASYVSTPAAGAPQASSNVLGPTPWKNYERDPHRPPDDPDEAHGGDAAAHAEIARAMNRLDIQDGTWRFHGKASAAHLLRLFSDLKYKQQDGTVTFLDSVNKSKRPEYWQVPEWEIVIANEGVQPIDYSLWPEPGFDKRLIESYFDMVNFHLPLLNKTIFYRQYDIGLYRTNHDFAKVCIMVFANGARFIDDDRVYWPRDQAMSEEGKERLRMDKDGTIRYSAGWKFLRAVMRMGRSIVQGPNLYDFQTQVLICAFFQGAAVPHLTWVISGLGLRSAEEIGIHVRSTLMLAHPIERALYNRAFWCLYHIDRTNCAAIGRSVAIQDTDFDADYPIAVDDEYWDTGDPAKNFVQPESAGVPKVASFVHMLKLDHVIGAALRTIYAINKLPEHKSDLASQRSVVVELDSALNSWADSVPDGLRWDPTRADQHLFEQSAVLYSQYYFCQILIHRPFIPTPKNPETIGLPSLAICSNASRSIVNILDAVLRRGRQFGALPGQAISVHFLLPAWTAAVVLLVSVYSGRQQQAERDRAMGDVRRCIAALKEMEVTWRQAGKLTDMLMELASERVDAPLPRLAELRQGAKRHLDGNGGPSNDQDNIGSNGSNASGSGSGSGSVHRKISGSSKVPSGSGKRGSASASYTPSPTSISPGLQKVDSRTDTMIIPNIFSSGAGAASSSSNSGQFHPSTFTPNMGSDTFPSTMSNRPSTVSNPPQQQQPFMSQWSGPHSQLNVPNQYEPQQQQQQSQNQNQNQNESQNHAQQQHNLNQVANEFNLPPYGTTEPLWDSTFFDALNPELFGMSDVPVDSMGIGGQGLAAGLNGGLAGSLGTGLVGAGINGINGQPAPMGLPSGMGPEVDDLWAQLFSGYPQGIWTPGISGTGNASSAGIFGNTSGSGSGQANASSCDNNQQRS